MEQSYERTVAVIGSGVAGLTAAYVLSGRDRVTLYEADSRLGGHAHTHVVDDGDGGMVGVDSAFLVHNDRTYPTLRRLFAELGVATQESEMSMSVRADDIGLEYAGALGARGLFACRQSLRPRYLLMLAEIKRFHRAATRLLRAGAGHDNQDHETLEVFLNRHRFSSYFVDYFITPLVAAVWSCAGANALCYPARYLFVFLTNREIPPTNNGSEQALRPCVIYRKVTNCFRSEWAAELYADIRSVIETARRHGIAALEAIRSTLNGLPLAATPLAQSPALHPSG